MPKGEREASLQEAKLLSALHHPNIVTCYESFTERGRLCIVMDFCSGGGVVASLPSGGVRLGTWTMPAVIIRTVF
jgi:serine/threonine protein kinase